MKPLKPRKMPTLHDDDHQAVESSGKTFQWKDSPAVLWFKTLKIDGDNNFAYGFKRKADSYDVSSDSRVPFIYETSFGVHAVDTHVDRWNETFSPAAQAL